ncbi:MAG: ABC transporter permease [Hyphomicrobiales bacterium]
MRHHEIKIDKAASDGSTMNAVSSGLRICAIVVVLLVLWQSAVSLLQLPPFILPGPWSVAQSGAANFFYLMGHAGITASEILIGLTLGLFMGVLTGLLMAMSSSVERLVFPVVLATQALPVFAIAPLLVLWFGFGLASKVIMATLIIYFPITSAFYDGLRRTDPDLLDLGRISGATPLQSLLHLRLPSALPSLSSGLRVGATLAPIGAVVGEWVGSSAGLGFIMLHANARMQTDLMFAALFILALFVLLLRFATEYLTRRLVFWMPESHAGTPSLT